MIKGPRNSKSEAIDSEDSTRPMMSRESATSRSVKPTKRNCAFLVTAAKNKTSEIPADRPNNIHPRSCSVAGLASINIVNATPAVAIAMK